MFCLGGASFESRHGLEDEVRKVRAGRRRVRVVARVLTLIVLAMPALAALGSTLPVQASGGTVTAPSAPTFSLNTASQDPGNFVLSGFSSSATLLVSIGFVDPPTGTTFALPTTTGLTAGHGYNFSGGKTQISFTGTQANANTALAAMTVSRVVRRATSPFA